MRIGELAEIAGVSTRAIRHYHHMGLLAEPTRRANGYRDYRLLPPDVLAELGPVVEGAAGLYARLDALHDAAPDDPRVAALAADLAGLLPASMLGGLGEEAGERWLAELGVEVSPAQAAVFHQVMAASRERRR